MKPTDMVAYFAHDWGDAATGRRVSALQRDGFKVSGFSMSRGVSAQPDWVTSDLGRTQDNAYAKRILSLITGTFRAISHRKDLRAADVFLARNLDMLLIAHATRRALALRTPIIYECLDIHRMMVRPDAVGKIFRKIEAYLLKRTSALWVSSPAFISAYFAPMHGDPVPWDLVENRMAAAPAQRPEIAEMEPTGEKLRIGWFGNLRCPRSLQLMETVANAFSGKVEIVLRGYPALGEIPDFHDRVTNKPGITFAGRYEWPDDLQSLYQSVDVVWAGDFMDAGGNSDWLLPNRLYEGGWFACPAIAPVSSETGRWIADQGTGFSISEPIEENCCGFDFRFNSQSRADLSGPQGSVGVARRSVYRARRRTARPDRTLVGELAQTLTAVF